MYRGPEPNYANQPYPIHPLSQHAGAVMTIPSNLGFPRIGRKRELKFALEQHWSGALDAAGLDAVATQLRAHHWRQQTGAGLSHVPSGDFSLYDHVLDTACMLGAIPGGYGWDGGPVSVATQFALARGDLHSGAKALEMTKWFDTNYHYLVPQLTAAQRFSLTRNRLLDQFEEAAANNIRTRPVLLGPVSFLLLSKMTDGTNPLALLPRLLPIYAEILAGLERGGAAWVQVDEPMLAVDLPQDALAALTAAYQTLSAGPAPEILLTSYFGSLGRNLSIAADLPVAGLHLDLVRGANDLETVLDVLPAGRWLSLGIVDGRNIWRTDLRRALTTLRSVAAKRGTRHLMVAPSCSLLHVPNDVTLETKLDPDVKSWLAFAVQKLDEIAALTRGLDEGDQAVEPALDASDRAARHRASSPLVHQPGLAVQLRAITPEMEHRRSPSTVRRGLQHAKLGLPLFPTTTIGSFPQTTEVRQARSGLARQDLTEAAYDTVVQNWIDDAVRWQEEIGLDVLVHGEFERNDMVKYFGEQLNGYAFTQHGWVQSYGSRCVAPPIIWGDVSRPAPMTVRWSVYAQSRTTRPMKGMLTGPVTMLQWSFVRDDMARSDVCRQIALAIRQEVLDLETAGIGVIQVDEPAFREGLPLRQADRDAYLAWAAGCFRLATSAVRDETSIHTHMCYAEFNDIMPAIADLDADVISIETTRSRMELLNAFAQRQTGGPGYPAEIGPGIWDIHSPRVPSTAEMVALLHLARDRLQDWQIWVNPDCGLKTRQWTEVKPALESLVAAARTLRAEVAIQP